MDRSFVVDKDQKSAKQKKIIKRYGNRKLYDTEQSSYVVLSDIAKMIRNNEEVCVIDNETKDDITTSTLTQIIFGAEKKSNFSAPLNILKSIIMKGDGSLSNFLAEMGLFRSSSPDQGLGPEKGGRARRQAPQKATLEERIVSAAASSHDIVEENEPPELPSANKTLERRD